MAKGNYKHGYYGTPTYKSWSEMVYRCKMGYAKLDLRWKKFEIFLSDMGERPKGTSIDRIDNSKGYTKSNCRWATNLQQQNNRTNNRRFLFDGKNKTLTEWSKVLGVNRSTLSQRFYVYGWSIERVLSTK